MDSNSSNFTSKVLTIEEKRRFDRQLRLPGWNQGYLKQSTVLIAGVGGLGVEIAKNLAMVGIGKLILVDLDTIEYSNFNRQILFVGAKEGDSKSKVAAKKLEEINPYITIDAYHCALQDLPPKVFYDADLYIGGLDNVEARQELNRRSVHNKKPLIEAGTATYNGHLYCIFPGKNACLECDPLRERENDDLAACTLVGKPRRPVHCVLKGNMQFEKDHDRSVDILNSKEISEVRLFANKMLKDYFPSAKPYTDDQIIQLIDNHEPTVITINCVLASLQSQEAVKILHHIHAKKDDNNKLGTLNLNYIIYNGLTGKFYEIEKPVNSNCQMCGSNKTPLYKIKVKSNLILKDIIELLAKEKKIPIDPEFPPMVLKIDAAEVIDCELEQSISDAGIQNYETILITGFEDESQVYLMFKLE